MLQKAGMKKSWKNDIIRKQSDPLSHQANPKQSGLGELCAQVLIDKKNQRRQKHAVKSV